MTTFSRILARAFLSLISLLSAGWAVFFLFNADYSVQLDNIANRIMSGDGFQQSPLLDSVPLLSSAESRAVCNPREMRGAAIIRVRLFEEATNASDTRLVDQRLKLLRSSVDLALGCVPTEGFLWFIRYWSAINAGSPAGEHFEELRMSYLLAPFEGWIAFRRSPYVLAIYDALPADLKESALNEMVTIIASGFISEAVNILQGPGSMIWDRLLPRLEKVRLDIRIRLDKVLRAQGLNIEIPGVEPREFRPWQ
jgi:hypothetical protein